MDQTMIAYFDERFREIALQLRGFHEEAMQQIQSLREETSQQIQSVREEISQLREETSQQIQSLREETSQQLQALREETSQQLQALREETSQQLQALREETSQQIQTLRDETSQQIRSLREEISQLREETAQQIQTLREETAQQIQSLREETMRRFGEVDLRFKEAEKTARQTLVLVEGLRHEIHLVAEAFMGVNQRLELVESRSALSFETAKGWMEPFFETMEKRGRDLDARSVQLDVPVKDLDNRVRVLEGWAARQGEDVMESLLKMVARYRLQAE